MLRQLLALIDQGGIAHEQALARRLGVRAPVVAEMLGHLAAQGYLRPLVNECATPSACGGCALATACSLGSTRLWQLTEQGRARLRTAVAR